MPAACRGSGPDDDKHMTFTTAAAAAILAHATGNCCAIAGRGKLAGWEKGGETRHGLSVIADRALTAYPAGKPRCAGAPAPRVG